MTHESVRYSLLDNHDRESEETHEDPFVPAVQTMARSSGGPSTTNTFAGRLRGSQRITFLLILVAFFVIIIWLLSTNLENNAADASGIKGGEDGSNQLKMPITLRSSLEWSAVLKPDGSKKSSDLRTDLDWIVVYDWYNEHCYKPEELGRSISDVHKKLQALKKSALEECRLIWEIFDSILRMDAIEAPISLPISFQTQVKGWLDNDEKLFEQANNQVVYKVVNKGTYEETAFNPIRSKRPVSKPSIDPLEYIKNLTASTKPTCDFCKYKEHTAEDIFGRIDNEYSASSSNTFKLAKFHGLFFPKQHSPLNLSLVQLQDLFLLTSKQWFEKAHESDPSQKYPSLMWDSLPHAGASQVHPHIHGLLDPHQYVGAFEAWHQVAVQYHKITKRSYWSDFVKLHFALGLGISKGKAVLLVPLTARKDNEYMILSPDMNDDVVGLIFAVLQTYQNKLNVFCFSGGGVYPKLGSDEDDTGMPVIFRFGARGMCTSVGSDVSSLELYTLNNINTDLAKTYKGIVEQMKL